MVKISPDNNFHNSNSANSNDSPSFEDVDDTLFSVAPKSSFSGVTWWQKKSIRWKTTILAIAMGTIPTITLGLVAYNVADNSIEEQITSERTTLVRGLQNEVNLFIVERFKDIQIMANWDIFTNSQIRDAISDREKTEALEKIKATYGVYNSIGIFDLQGDVIAQTGTKPLGNHLNRSYIQAALTQDRPVLSQPRISTTSGIFSIYVAAPVKDKTTGETIAIIRARMPVAVLKELLQDYTQKGDRYYLLDGEGMVFLGSAGEYVISTLSNDRTTTEKPTTSYEAINIEEVFSGISPLLNSNQPTTVTSAIDLETKEKQFVAFAPSEKLSQVPDLDWQVLIATDRTQVFAPQKRLQKTYALGSIAVAILTGVVASYLARLAIRPILTAAKTVEEIGAGNLQARIAVTGRDETAQLATNINQMALQLEKFVWAQNLLAKQTDNLTETVLSLSTTTDIDRVWQIALNRARLGLSADGVVYYSLDSEEIIAESLASTTPTTIGQKIYEPIWIREYLAQHSESAVSTINDLSSPELTTSQSNKLKAMGIRTMAIAKIERQGIPIGLLIAYQSAYKADWQKGDLDFFGQIADRVNFTLDRLDSIEQQQAAQIKQNEDKERLQQRALELLQQVDALSQGDLTIRANVTEDEIGTIADSYNATIYSLQKLVTQVKTAANRVEQTAGNNQTIVDSLAIEATEQAQSIALTMQQIQKMSQSIDRVSESADRAEEIVKEANQTILTGDKIMNQAVIQINALQATVSQTEQKVRLLGESSQEISQVVNSISRFAAQTHLLALKASIEAARAGEQGKGFATIADEVRSLATQSATASTDIENLVTRIQLETNEVVSAMAQGTKQVTLGTNLVQKTRQHLDRVTAASQEINQLIIDISQSARGQSKLSHQVSQNIVDVAVSAQTNSQSATQVSLEIEELLTVAHQLQTDIDRFKT